MSMCFQLRKSQLPVSSWSQAHSLEGASDRPAWHRVAQRVVTWERGGGVAAGPIGWLWLPRGHLRPKVLVSEPQSTAGQVSLSHGFGRLPARRGLRESSVGTLSGSPGQAQSEVLFRHSDAANQLLSEIFQDKCNHAVYKRGFSGKENV